MKDHRILGSYEGGSPEDIKHWTTYFFLVMRWVRLLLWNVYRMR